ncbi:MAG TPA: G1 family glutamic endopeptidase [Nitrososphaerales archaeon]|nr:G1 family glutamic endopeptidase [Nitrososphaerales archaeon]
MNSFSRIVLITGFVFIILTVGLPSFVYGSNISTQTIAPNHLSLSASKILKSVNWGGYEVNSSSGSVVAAKASWIEPSVTCNSASDNEAVAFWVGIDGFKSSTVEQIGTIAICLDGLVAYRAWYEFYPEQPNIIAISNIAVNPGDVFSASVTYITSSKLFVATITDLTNSQTNSTSASVSGAQRNSAEWIVEAPSSTSGILPMPNFGTVSFGKSFTSVSGTCTATIIVSGKAVTHPISGWGTLKTPGTNKFAITMVSFYNSKIVKASASRLTPGSSFTDTWHSAGP